MQITKITIEGSGDPIIITTENSSSSYGIPVAIIEGQAYGPGDQPTAKEILHEIKHAKEFMEKWHKGIPQRSC
jgi:hypothetical protein